MEGALCRYNVTCTSPDEEEEEDIVHTDVVPSRIMQTSKSFGNAYKALVSRLC
jgi:protein ECT2